MAEPIPTRKSDLPLSAALVLLAAIVFLLLVGPKASTLGKELSPLASALEANLVYFISALVVGSFSFAWIFAQCRRFFKLTRQGSRLKDLLGKPVSHGKQLILPLAVASLFAAVTFVECLLIPSEETLPYGLSKNLLMAWNILEISAALSMALGGSLLSLLFYSALEWFSLRPERARKALSNFPKLANSITLGSFDEGENDRAPSWLTLPKHALNGNILVTGSIGSGKTQGTILTYYDQIMRNFDPRPSVLAIDPKGTFVPEAQKIIEELRLKDKCLHMCLGGSVKFNPIYDPHALKNARFVEIAYMIQSAAANFMGRSSDSVFWESHSFNLIRHSLAYCSSKQSYYTLLDLYETILASMGDELPEKIKENLDTKKFDDEEIFNIMRAYDYFSMEFRKLDDKVRTGIVATATAFLNQFQEYKAHEIFCPKEKENRLLSLDEVVDQGRILLFDIANPALAKSMGIVIKLLYQKSLLDRLKIKGRGKKIPGVLVIDEYQDVVTTSNGTSVGDDRFLAKGREANAISIFATQSQTSLQDAIGRDSATKSLLQCFRTRIAGHSSDLATIHSFQELVGQEDKEKLSHSFSELSQDAKKNHVLGGFESNNANISESVSKSLQKESTLTGKEFFALNSFECFALVYDGVKSKFHKLFLKPYFLKKKETLHVDLIKQIGAVCIALFLGVTTSSSVGNGFPNVCDVVRAPEFSSCMHFRTSGCVCRGWPPRPCARFTYFLPKTYIEVHPNAAETYFNTLPGAQAQLSGLRTTAFPYGAEGDSDTQSFHAHTLAVPLASTILDQLPCGASFSDNTCFESMSEHLGRKWKTGSPDHLQPNFLAWMASPKGCLLAGAASSIAGGSPVSAGGGSGSCSVPMALETYPPSPHFACNGWGVFYPRGGVYSGPSQTAGALMIAARMKSLATEVFQTTPSSPAERWQMIKPQSSACFSEGENVLPLETIKHATEFRRLSGARPKGYLFTIWHPVSCCKELTEIPKAMAVLAGLRAACQAGGGR